MGMLIDLQSSQGHALVVGGGVIATRKVKSLVEAEFRITVVAPDVSEEIRLAAWTTVFERAFEETDVTSEPRPALVFACTNDRATNQEIGRIARREHIPVVVTDAQEESTFFTPAILRDGDLAIAVSTGGASPSIAREVRERIVAALGPGWGSIVRLARSERDKQRAETRRTDE